MYYSKLVCTQIKVKDGAQKVPKKNNTLITTDQSMLNFTKGVPLE